MYIIICNFYCFNESAGKIFGFKELLEVQEILISEKDIKWEVLVLHYLDYTLQGGNMLDGGELSLESGFDYKEIRQLIELGHKVIFDLGSFGGYQAIMYDGKMGVYYGASESRKDGSAMGY